MENTELLRGTSFFKYFSTMEIMRFNRVIFSKNVPAGEDIIRVGDAGDALYVIKHGRVGVMVDKDPNSPPIQVNTLGEMDYFGEMSLLDDATRSATIKAITDTQLIVLKRSDLEKIINSDFEMAAKFYKSVAIALAHRLRKANETIYTTTSMLASATIRADS
jgi:CRP-like cAMP-binding protein